MDFKDRMIEAYERGECGYYEAYDYVRESMADAADRQRKTEKENPPESEEKSKAKQAGQAIVEYALLIAVVVLLLTPAVMYLTNALEELFARTAQEMDSEPAPLPPTPAP